MSAVLDNTKQVTPEVVAEAKAYGWVEKDKFRGDEKEWVDAAEYVQRGRNSIPILRQKLSKSEGAFKALQTEVAQLKSDMDVVRQVGYDQAAKEWQAKYDQLKLEKVKAIQDDDAAAIVEADEAIAEHKAAPPKKPEEKKTVSGVQDLPQDQQDWFAQNEWFEKDKILRARANAMSISFAEDGLKGVALYEAVKAELIAMFPDEMAKYEGHTPPTRSGAVHRSTGRAPTRDLSGGDHTYDNLPADAKVVCDRLVAAKKLTRDEYVANYKGWK